MRDDRTVRTVDTSEGLPEAGSKLPSRRLVTVSRASSSSGGVAPVPVATLPNRNGVPLLPSLRDGRRATSEVVDRLRDEI